MIDKSVYTRGLRAFLMGATALTTMSAGVAAAQTAPGGAQAVVDGQDAQTEAAASGAPADKGDIVVTGSRIITNGNDSPTPLTTVQVETLQATTPSNIPDALNKLPAFNGSRTQRTTGGSTINWPGNFLNLRNLGSNRTLILLDGMRVPATDSSANVDTNTLPQSLVSRVDVVTGGASAVYGSDAVTGVVNFVLNKKFEGIEATGQYGISQQGDAGSWRASITAGTSFAGGRGHIEVSGEHYRSNGIDSMMKRPGGALAYQEVAEKTALGAAGSANNPYHRVAGVRSLTLTPGGYIAAGPLANSTFGSNGVLTPFTHGTPITGVLEVGGDGGYSGQGYFLFPGVDNNPWLTADLTTDRIFGRADFDVTESINVFVQGNYSFAENYNVSGVKSFTSNFAADNGYLPAAARTALTNAGAGTFSMSKALQNRIGDISNGVTNSWTVMAGATGKLFDGVDFDVHYIHGRSRLRERAPDTLNNQKLFAALDAVSSGGKVVCRVSTTASAGLFPGCQPFNAFGPSADSDSAFDYITDDTQFFTTNVMDDVAGSVSGTVFEGWAGPIKAALSGEYRKVSLQVLSSFDPTLKVNCTGLNAATCDPSRAVWNGVVANLPTVSEAVTEGALEVEVPLLRDIPAIQQFNLNGAIRYTSYGISGDVATWKVGGVWQVFSDLKLRATRSRDIRAPNLSNLFAPTNQNYTAFTDYLTGLSGQTTTVSKGNPNLNPEKSNTLALGAVYTPSWLPSFSVSLDYYSIKITDVITSVNGGSATSQQLCLASDGSSPYCALVVRPISYNSTAPGNFPTQVISASLNSGYVKTNGIDAEMSYRFNLGAGKVSTRLLFSYQPSFKSFSGIPGAVVTDAAGAQGFYSLAKERATAFVGYENGPFSINLQERWHSSTRNSANPTLVYVEGNVPGYFYTDLGVRYKFKLGSGSSDADRDTAEIFLSVQNLFDRDPTVWIDTSRTGAPGYAYPAPFDEDAIGRYITAGVRLRF